MADEEGLSANLVLRRGAMSRVGLERVALLEAVEELGSISAAAQRLGLSYKGAWDAAQALNNLFDVPLIEAAPGGRTGGAARVTERGHAVAEAFRRMQRELDEVVRRLETGLAAGTPLDLLWSLGMRTSARNALRGVVSRVTPGAVNGEVALSLGDGTEIVSTITMQSIADIGLAPGRPAVAIVKSSFVVLAKGEGLRTSARNQIPGVVLRRDDGAVNSEIMLDIGGGKTLTAGVTLESAKALNIAVGDAMTALIKAPHVILAVE